MLPSLQLRIAVRLPEGECGFSYPKRPDRLWALFLRSYAAGTFGFLLEGGGVNEWSCASCFLHVFTACTGTSAVIALDVPTSRCQTIRNRTLWRALLMPVYFTLLTNQTISEGA
jgi:hypothetical protein